MARHGLLEPREAEDMFTWDHHGGGFNLDSSVRIEAADRAGLERLIRPRADPPTHLLLLPGFGPLPCLPRSPRDPAGPQFFLSFILSRDRSR